MCNDGIRPELASPDIHSDDYLEGRTGNSVPPIPPFYNVDLTVNIFASLRLTQIFINKLYCLFHYVNNI